MKISWNSLKPWSCTLLGDSAHWPQTVFCSPLCLFHLSCFNSARPWSQLSSCMAVVYWNRLTQTEFYLCFFLHKIFCSSRKLPTHYFPRLRWQYTDISLSGCLMHSSTAFQGFFLLNISSCHLDTKKVGIFFSILHHSQCTLVYLCERIYHKCDLYLFPLSPHHFSLLFSHTTGVLRTLWIWTHCHEIFVMYSVLAAHFLFDTFKCWPHDGVFAVDPDKDMPKATFDPTKSWRDISLQTANVNSKVRFIRQVYFWLLFPTRQVLTLWSVGRPNLPSQAMSREWNL